eukprot:c20856_g2_i2 orf=41-1594(+)
MESNEPQSSRLIEETSTLIYDSSATITRRKRREVRFLKKFSCTPGSSIRGLNLVHQGALKRTCSRPSTFCNSIYLFDGGTQEEDENCFADFFSNFSEEQGFGSGLARSRSYPLEGWHTRKYVLQISKIGCPPLAKFVKNCTTVEDDHCQTLDTRSSCTTKTPRADDPECGWEGLCTSPQLRKSDILPQDKTSVSIKEDLASLTNLVSLNKVSPDKEVEMKTSIDQLQAVVNIAPQWGTNDSAGKPALPCNAEGTFSTPLEERVLQLQQASSRGNPLSGKVSICGRRREMEDTAVIVPSFARVPHGVVTNGEMESEMMDLHFYGVYDGHGGSQASNYCAERLHHALAEEISSCAMTGDSNNNEWYSTMSSSFMKVDKEVGGVCPYGACDDVDSSAGCCLGSIAPENVGTTAVVAVVSSSQIILANCGDSRAVLSRGGKAIPLSQDHKPERVDETSRIEAAGGRVIAWKGYRVGALLAVSRSIGDRYLKRYVISEPDVTCLQRTEEDEFMILASDGLWD